MAQRADCLFLDGHQRSRHRAAKRSKVLASYDGALFVVSRPFSWPASRSLESRSRQRHIDGDCATYERSAASIAAPRAKARDDKGLATRARNDKRSRSARQDAARRKRDARSRGRTRGNLGREHAELQRAFAAPGSTESGRSRSLTARIERVRIETERAVAAWEAALTRWKARTGGDRFQTMGSILTPGHRARGVIERK